MVAAVSNRNSKVSLDEVPVGKQSTRINARANPTLGLLIKHGSSRVYRFRGACDKSGGQSDLLNSYHHHLSHTALAALNELAFTTVTLRTSRLDVRTSFFSQPGVFSV